MEALQEREISGKSTNLPVRLQCPRCAMPLRGTSCNQCGFILRMENGIWKAMTEERLEYYAQFIHDYERIRSAEGRGSSSPDFYLNLPYKDVSGTNDKQWAIRARSFLYLVRHLLNQHSADSPMRVLDLGAGNGWLSYRLALSGHHPFAVDLLTNAFDGLGAAENYQEQLLKLFPRFQAECAHLPFASNQFDAAIFNASFHYSEDYRGSLSEALRCVKSGGLVVICDTPWYAADESGRRMVAERHRHFLSTYGIASDSIRSMEYLTDERLKALERDFSIRWDIHTPWYGFQWAARPLVARIRRRREPSHFRIYSTRKVA
jgi:SAM-dependent methyltransferase